MSYTNTNTNTITDQFHSVLLLSLCVDLYTEATAYTTSGEDLFITAHCNSVQKLYNLAGRICVLYSRDLTIAIGLSAW